MAIRKITVFKIKGEVVVENNQDLTPKEIEDMKWVVAEECDVAIFEVTAETLTNEQELSDIDVTADGLLDWKDTYFVTIHGLKMNLVLGSDEHLDAISNGTIAEYITYLK